MKKASPALLLVGALLAAPTALAQSLTGNVGSAAITKGERDLEVRVGVNSEDEADSRVHYTHAFTDWYQLRTIVSFEKDDGQGWDYGSLGFENWFQWREEAKDGSGFNGGLRLGYAFEDGAGPDEAEVRLTLTDKFAGAWEWRTNVIAEFETGSGSEGGAELETRFQLTRGMPAPFLGASRWRLGAEILSEYGNTRDFAALDDQAHQVGPVVKFEWDNGVYLQSSVRFGLTDAADDVMGKVFVGREF